jgi:hypothetical protein
MIIAASAAPSIPFTHAIMLAAVVINPRKGPIIWQSSRPGYYARVDALNLKRGDASSMWMLDFRSPYADPDSVSAYASASNALANALDSRQTPQFLPAFDRFLAARHAFANSVRPRNWRYLDFQLWQESGARWTEYAIAKVGDTAAARDAALWGEARTLSASDPPIWPRRAAISHTLMARRKSCW